MLLNEFRLRIASQLPVVDARLPIALFASTALIAQPLAGGVALANDMLPTGGQVVSGQVSIGTSGSGMTVTQGSSKAIVNWNGFSVGQGNSVNFVQPNSSSAILNRVTGSATSSIAGSLTGNGQVYIINPNGIAITPTGTVNVTGGFVASTLDISNDDFLQGQYRFSGDGSSAGVSNEGVVTVGRGGYAALIGGTVKNDGLIAVPVGKAGLGSGEQATLDLSGDGFLQVAVPTSNSAEGNGALIENKGTISAEGGTVVMRAATARNAARHAVNLSGSVEADSISGSDGEIVIGGGEGGEVTVSGNASAKSSTGKGGKITVTGTSVALNGAKLDASGAKGGGSVKISGGSHASGATQRAKTVSVGSASAIKANATQSGTGGSVQVDADVLHNTGQIVATGTAGGSVTLGANSLVNAGLMDVSGLGGAGGSVDIVARDNYIETTAGLIRADGTTGGGGVSIQSGRLFTSGTLTAKASQGVGGTLTLTGADMDLVAAHLDATGTAGGGQIRVGGDYQGGGTLAHAATLDISPATVIKADATQSGSGGRIILWSDNATTFYGTASANGGWLSGNGGLIEISSKGLLTMAGTASASARNGAKGTVLLDPKNIVINDATGALAQYEFIDPNPSAGNSFGEETVSLSTGNVVISSYYADLSATDVGAVYLYNGITGALISALYGSKAEDRVGEYGITALTNGNYVVASSSWDNGSAIDVGAVTWGNGTTGISGFVSENNSLVGSTQGDRVGTDGVTALANGNYVVGSISWDNGSTTNAGAVTWGNGTTGTVGNVSASNSLVGTKQDDVVGNGRVVGLSNGNYVVMSRSWDNGSVTDAGAVTWGNGNGGTVGAVSENNSLVGTTQNDQVGGSGVSVLTNGNYVVRNSNWDNASVVDAGAVTWGNGTTGTVGNVSASNSLVGTTQNDQVGSYGVTVLANGNYVVSSSSWDNGSVVNAGAVTWGNGTTGTVGNVSASNSLVGTTQNDQVESYGVTALTNGNYVVRSAYWDNNSIKDAGAVTWGNGNGSTFGALSENNSLVGTTNDDQVGLQAIVSLTNGNYVVVTRYWDKDSVKDVGAVTWGNGTGGTFGKVSASNSLVGTKANDEVGNGSVYALTNGNYVVRSTLWDNDSTANVGAVTWGDGTTGISGSISANNSLVGTTQNDQVGASGITALTNGNYVVSSRSWDNNSITDAGAVTWGNGTTGISGFVSETNSLVGTKSGDYVGNAAAIALTNGNYVVRSSYWDNGSVANVGAVTWGNGLIGTIGAVSESNSLIGSRSNDAVGGSGVYALSNGNYVVSSNTWDNGATADVGALTWGNGSMSTSDFVGASNSLVGQSMGDQLSYDEENSSAGIFIGRTVNDITHVYAGLTDINAANGGLTYQRLPGQTLTLSTGALTSILDSGTNLSLQASNDISILSPIISLGMGSLSLSAGRSIIISREITVGGNLTLLANAPQSDGVIAADRETGAAVIDTSGAILNVAGTFTGTIGTGDGRTENASGNLSLGNITAGAVNLANLGLTTGTAIALTGNISTAGNQAYDGALKINGADVTLATDHGGKIDWKQESTSSISAGTAGNKITFSEGGVTTRVGVLDTADAARLALAGGNVSRTYGDANPALGGWALTAGALRSGHTLDTLLTTAPTLNWANTAADANSNVGSYEYQLNGTGAALASNAQGYFLNLAPVTGMLTVNKAQLTVTAANGTMVYGDAAPNLGYSVSGWKNGQTDSLLSNVTVSTNANSSSNVGNTYQTAASGGTLSGQATGNYTLAYANGSFSVTQAALTITADDASMTAGATVPTIGYSVAGWKGNHGNSLLSNVTAYTNATGSSPAGSQYSTFVEGGTLSDSASGNYNVRYQAGRMTVTAASSGSTGGGNVITLPTPTTIPSLPNPVFTSSPSGGFNPVQVTTVASISPQRVSFNTDIQARIQQAVATSMTIESPKMSGAVCSLGPNFSVSCSAN
ncbi:MBG domain-containing protein [Rhizobium sp. WCS2018Hpa-8]|uniref:two-partner secretion domain-containing protein n=3 Tax=unclassified Rhizobium TaxID=2613769 RepID=UPI00288BBBE4|nr:MBG domain-containing protein [Rhizobium sp. WCS2018Hpa-8]